MLPFRYKEGIFNLFDQGSGAVMFHNVFMMAKFSRAQAFSMEFRSIRVVKQKRFDKTSSTFSCLRTFC